MKNAATLKSSKTDSPKTPGGISKSLLTPCRRVGLSRNFRKSGASPFQSPLSSKTGVQQENVESRKRKELCDETPQTPENDACASLDVTQTPTRVEVPRRKRSKTLLASINTRREENNLIQDVYESTENKPSNIDTVTKQTEAMEATTPSRLKSKSRSKKNLAPNKTSAKDTTITNTEKENLDTNSIVVTEPNENTEILEEAKEKTPNNLTKECIVLIQKKIFKKELNQQEVSSSTESKEMHEKCPSTSTKETVSQAVFDSDSDDVPLICLNNKDTHIEVVKNDEDKDFALTKPKTAKLQKTKSKTKLKSPISTKSKNNSKTAKAEIQLPNSLSSVDEDDDFFEKKRTILIRKSYDKVIKPQKAKSTGSITQKDVDDLKNRIEIKKKMLLARAMKDDTQELRDLIKKWQRGCQDALMELMDLMKSKFPDKQNMDYSEILQTLKIPASIVGYDSDNDCFLTPDDESIILGKI